MNAMLKDKTMQTDSSTPPSGGLGGAIDLEKHPCFNIEAKGKYGRVHLPVAPKCNIQCNYCKRDYDCVNESRPGVTSEVLSPEQALAYLIRLKEKMPNLSVVGIAGPGDPFANPHETMTTLRLVRQHFPEMILCLSSNGLNVAPYVAEIAELKVSHVTITMNSLDTEVTKDIYKWARFENRGYVGKAAADLLLEKQLLAIKLLREHGITVKINTIVIPGMNEHVIEGVAEKAKELGAELMNAIQLFPVADTGIRIAEMTGLIDEGLDAIYKGKELRTVKKADVFKCGSACSGKATGC